MNQPAGTSERSSKVVIAGTGRAGTTFLVQVLTDLGLDTGFTSAAEGDPRTRGGLEKDITDANAPKIIKSPQLSSQLGDLLETKQVTVEHVIVPMRQLEVAAASRVRSTRYGKTPGIPGGLFGTSRATRQLASLATLEYELFFTIARFDLPHTILSFPRFAQDWKYTYRKLSFLAPSLPPERWREALESRFQPDWVHEAPLSSRERALASAGTFYQRGIRAPMRAAARVARGQPARPS